MEDFGRAVSVGAYMSHWGQENLTTIGSQRYLRACGCFAVLSAVSSKLVFQNRRSTPPVISLPIELSKQEILDCVPHDGGLSYKKIYGYICNHGVLREAVYPYEGLFDGHCRCTDYLGCPRIRVAGFTRICRKEAGLVLKKCPLTATMKFYESFRVLGYSLEVYEPLPGEKPKIPGRHAVLVIGCGEIVAGVSKKKYCLIQNEWGLSWGVNGYARVAPHLLDGFTLPQFVWDEAVDG